MDQGTLGLATKLLAKAQGTSFDPEAAALTERAYRLLAVELNAYDDQASAAGQPRRRERRFLIDRRATRPTSASASADAGPVPSADWINIPSTPNGRRAEWFASPCERLVDLRV